MIDSIMSNKIGDWGELIDAGDPQSGNRFRFRFVFVSCVRASGRGEAVWACERGVILNAGGLLSNIFSGRGLALACPWFLLLRFVAIYMVLSPFRTDCCYAHGLFDLFLFLMVCSWVFWCFRNRWTQQIISTVDFIRWSQQQISTDNRNKLMKF